MGWRKTPRAIRRDQWCVKCTQAEQRLTHGNSMLLQVLVQIITILQELELSSHHCLAIDFIEHKQSASHFAMHHDAYAASVVVALERFIRMHSIHEGTSRDPSIKYQAAALNNTDFEQQNSKGNIYSLSCTFEIICWLCRFAQLFKTLSSDIAQGS